jgi:hypothetical protein
MALFLTQNLFVASGIDLFDYLIYLVNAANPVRILEANDGSIWFGSAGPESGVHRYDGKTITDFRRKENQK